MPIGYNLKQQQVNQIAIQPRSSMFDDVIRNSSFNYNYIYSIVPRSSVWDCEINMPP